MAADGKRKSVGSVLLGVTVVGLYFLFVSLVAFGFGSYIYRTTWQVEAATDANGNIEQAQSVDIDNMLFILKREQSLEASKTEIMGQIAKAEIELSGFGSRVKQSFGPIARAKDALRDQMIVSVDALEDYRFALPGTNRSAFELVMNDENFDPDAKVRSLLQIVDTGLNPESADVSPELRRAFENLKTRSEQVFDDLITTRDAAIKASLDVQSEQSVVKSQITALTDKIENHDKAIAELQERLPLASVARARLAALSLDSPIFPDILMRLVSFPTIFLTLIVTIAAGGLGTVVAFSRRYYSSKQAENLTLSRLFVNVGEGIAAAIAIFLFSGAGMLALTQGGSPGNDVELSPYTVAFIAFLSGFMAEDAFASIQSAGKRIFKPNPASDGTKRGDDTVIDTIAGDDTTG
ncbi:hypothetical protein [uncultured Tateyamaria sp.]|uniref:hypothetical protein n=1 Tax=uncultured Tateyamaria sp. TaxID=455651 RepID=UPI0026351CE4|nr:hypothetical protein [uncultured Tateyamaria sp.]